MPELGNAPRAAGFPHRHSVPPLREAGAGARPGGEGGGRWRRAPAPHGRVPPRRRREPSPRQTQPRCAMAGRRLMGLLLAFAAILGTGREARAGHGTGGGPGWARPGGEGPGGRGVVCA